MAQLQGGGASLSGYKKPSGAITAPASKLNPAPGYGIITATPSKKPASKGYGGGGYSGGGYGGGASMGGYVGSTSGGAISSAPPAPRPPSLADFLGSDSTYMQQKSALDKARADYLAQQGQSKTQYLTGYTTDKNTLGQNRQQSLADLENDFAGRGLLQSGLYADSLANTNRDFDTKASALEQAKAAFLAQLAGDLTNFTSEQGLTLTKAQQEAAARRAAQYGV